MRDFFQEQRNTLGVYWYDELLGTLEKDGKNTLWKGGTKKHFDMLGVADETEMPAFLKNMRPEGWLFDVLDYRDQWTYLREGLRFLSNLKMVAPEDRASFPKGLPIDALQGRLDNFMRPDGVFSGTYCGPPQEGLMGRTEEAVAAFWDERDMPRLSGVQMKLPMHLDENGRIYPSTETDKSFTHILKLPNGGILCALGALEWFCLEIAERSGLDTTKHALVELPQGLPPAVLVERFDIPQTSDEKEKILMMDFCSLQKRPPHEKDVGSVEDCIKTLKDVSTQWEQDRLRLFDRIVLSYALRDGDMHKKNLSVLKRLAGDDYESISVKLSPIYDVLCTAVFSEKDRMALPLNGKKEGLNRKTWEHLGRCFGMDPQKSGDRALALMGNIAQTAVALCNDLPPEIEKHDFCTYTLKRTTTEIVDLAKKNGLDVPEWTALYDPKKEKPDKIRAVFNKRGKVRNALGLDYEEHSFLDDCKMVLPPQLP